MINPFKAVGNMTSEMYKDAVNSDVAPGVALIGTTLTMPVMIPVTFVLALFKKKANYAPLD